MRKIIKGEEDFDENGILRDGGRYRVGVRMSDSKKPASKQHLVDGSGNGDLALNRPGYRQLVGGNANTLAAWDAMNRITKATYAADSRYKENAWKDAVLEEDDDNAIYEATTEAQSTDAYLEYEARIKDEWKNGNE